MQDQLFWGCTSTSLHWFNTRSETSQLVSLFCTTKGSERVISLNVLLLPPVRLLLLQLLLSSGQDWEFVLFHIWILCNAWSNLMQEIQSLNGCPLMLFNLHFIRINMVYVPGCEYMILHVYLAMSPTHTQAISNVVSYSHFYHPSRWY